MVSSEASQFNRFISWFLVLGSGGLGSFVSQYPFHPIPSVCSSVSLALIFFFFFLSFLALQRFPHVYIRRRTGQSRGDRRL